MADFAGRRLGLPSTTFNPATWGKVLKPQEPAVESVTSRTADLVSMLEVFFPGDRRVSSRRWWPKRWRHLLVLPTLSALCLAHSTVLKANGNVSLARAMGGVSALLLVLGVALFVGELHTVLNFTISHEEKQRIAEAAGAQQQQQQQPPHVGQAPLAAIEAASVLNTRRADAMMLPFRTSMMLRVE